MKLAPNQWTYWRRFEPMPDELPVYEGGWAHRAKVGTINRGSVLAHCRWQKDKPCPHQVLKSGRWIDVLIVGEMGDDDD